MVNATRENVTVTKDFEELHAMKRLVLVIAPDMENALMESVNVTLDIEVGDA